MAMILGVGDEVVQFLIVSVLIMVAILAWLSTNARPDRYRTVLFMRSRAHHPVTVSIRTRQGIRTPQSRNSAVQTSTVQLAGSSNPPQARADNSNQTVNRVIPLQEMDSIVDADMAMMDNNRLHFYRRVEAPPTAEQSESANDVTDAPASQAEQEPASNAQIREMDSIVSAMEAELTDTSGYDLFAESGTSSETSKDATSKKKETKDKPLNENANTDGSSGTTSNAKEPDNRPKILIRLKYLNDTLKEVDGCLDELLKDFKSRHFSAELSSESRVRLIFNGRVLLDEAATLRACGLHHRAVVHCLVHPKRSAPPHAQPARNGAHAQQQGFPDAVNATHELVTETAQGGERSWDLENILMTLVSIGLTVVWFFRCEYANMFTASASVALFGLTVFYSVAIFGLYLSDTFHFERRPVPPVPAN